MVGRDRVRHVLQQHGLTGLRLRHDQAALALADGGEEIEHAHADVRVLPGEVELLVREQRARDAVVVPEALGEMTVPVPDEHQLGAPAPDLGPLRVELGRLLPTEEAAEVAQEDQHHRPLRPQLSQLVLLPLQVADDGVGGGVGDQVRVPGAWRATRSGTSCFKYHLRLTPR